MRAKHTEHTVILFILFFSTHFTINAQSSLKLWYNRPATQWVEALPVGNGRIGGMIYGGVAEELIQLNESTLYSGGPVKTNINPESPGYLPKIREALLKEEDYTKANLLTKKMQGLFTESYLPLGDIMIRHNFRGATPSAYYRDLDIQKAIATTRFTIDGVEYVREVFTSSPANIMMVRIRSTGKNAVSFDVSARSQLHYDVMANGNNELLINGKAPAHADPGYLNPVGREHEVYEDTTGCNGMRFQYRVSVSRISSSVKGLPLMGTTLSSVDCCLPIYVFTYAGDKEKTTSFSRSFAPGLFTRLFIRLQEKICEPV